MKAKNITVLLVVLLLVSCSNDDNQMPNEDSPIWSWANFEFVKPNGLLFEEGEVEIMQAVINSVGDTIYTEWMPMPYSHEVPQELSNYEGFFGPLVVAELEPNSLEEGEEWNRTAMYWFKYADSDIIDFLRINDIGVHPEYRQIEFYLNDEPFDPFAELYGDSFFFEIVKEEP
jgi:hypothetical protein